MYKIEYTKGIIETNYKQIVNIHRPFGPKVDKRARKASIKKLTVSPDDTVNTPQMRKFLVYTNTRYAYKLFNTYKENFKCHHIYKTNKTVEKLLRLKVVNRVIEEIDSFHNLKKDILNSLNILINSWKFDGIITDIPWIIGETNLKTIFIDWNLTNSTDHNIKLILKEYKTIPLNVISFNIFKTLNLSNTDVTINDFKCPLILIKSNNYYASFLCQMFKKGLPVTLFQI